MKKILIFSFIAVMVFSLAGCGSAPVSESGSAESSLSEPASSETGDDVYGARAFSDASLLSVEDMLLYAIQDEYLARAEYEYIITELGEDKPFSNIIKSEETHIAMLKDLYNAYGLEIPEDDAALHLIVPADVREALETGVQAEIDNIAMYEKFLEQDIPDDVRSSFEALRDASKSHLKAFQNNLAKY